MKKNIIYIMMLLLTSVALVSCDGDSTEGKTRVTVYPVLTLTGDVTVYVDKGAEYTEPGYTATLDGTDVTSQVKVSAAPDTNVSGVYTITYSITNTDGFSSSASRTVIVTDPNDPVEGIYYSTADSYRSYNGATTYYNGNYQTIIINQGDGTYLVDDMLGGWYCYRAGYGTNYQMQGLITVADDGTISLEASYIAGWGDSLVDFADGKYDSATGNISWTATYVSSMAFYLTLTK